MSRDCLGYTTCSSFTRGSEANIAAALAATTPPDCTTLAAVPIAGGGQTELDELNAAVKDCMPEYPSDSFSIQVDAKLQCSPVTADRGLRSIHGACSAQSSQRRHHRALKHSRHRAAPTKSPESPMEKLQAGSLGFGSAIPPELGGVPNRSTVSLESISSPAMGFRQRVVGRMRIAKPEARSFYEIEAARESWIVRELKRQVAALLSVTPCSDGFEPRSGQGKRGKPKEASTFRTTASIEQARLAKQMSTCLGDH